MKINLFYAIEIIQKKKQVLNACLLLKLNLITVNIHFFNRLYKKFHLLADKWL